MIIRSTRVVLPSSVQPADVHIADGRISRIEPRTPNPPTPDPRHPTPALHDVGDLVVSPGLVDTHVHVNEPGRTDWEGFATATRAAAAGGVTTIVDMPLNSIPATTTRAALEAKRGAAAGKLAVDVAFWGGVVPGNDGDLDPLADAGVCGFKCFLAPSGVDEFAAVGEPDLRRAMPILARRGLPLLAHAESPASLRAVAHDADSREYAAWLESRPPRAEVEAIELLIALAREFRCHVHIVHLAAAEALPVLAAARRDGVPITVETCPHYLTFAADEIARGATLFKCAPPIRDRDTREALWRALAQGAIDLVATDHSPCPPSLKDRRDFAAAWGGIASIELGLRAVWTGARARSLGLAQIASWMSAAPARLCGFAGRKGAIAPGMDADLVVWDPDAESVVDSLRLHQRHQQTPYAGCELTGRIVETFVRGQLVYRDGTAPDGIVDASAGSLLSRMP